MDLLGDKPLVDSQLIRSSRKLESLGNLAESLVSTLMRGHAYTLSAGSSTRCLICRLWPRNRFLRAPRCQAVK